MQGPPAGEEIFDVCVVGSGPAGLAVALTCGARGRSVVVLEAGGEEGTSSPADDVSILDDVSHALLDISTRMHFGGTSSAWGGLCVPFDPIDFEERPWASAPAWPVAYAEVARWFYEAGNFLDCGLVFESTGSFLAAAESVDTRQIGRLTRKASLSRTYRASISSSKAIRLCLSSLAVGLACDAGGGDVQGVDVVYKGAVKTVRARQVVIAAGGLRSTRLLLSLARTRPFPLGAALGRNYMGHLTGEIATVVFRDPRQAAEYFYRRDRQARWAQKRIKIAPSHQRSEGLLNTAFTLRAPVLQDHKHADGALSAMLLLASTPGLNRIVKSSRLDEAVAALRPGDRRHHLLNILRRPTATVRNISRAIRQSFVENLPIMMPNTSGRYSLRYHAEQMPNPDSRVFLHDSDPSHLVIDFRYRPEDVASVIRSHEILDEALRSTGTGHLEYHVPAGERHGAVRTQARDGYHQIGTTPMSVDPCAGVVDANCRVHGISNLYVASASTFPTSGSANPTLLIVTMALRLADHICGRVLG